MNTYCLSNPIYILFTNVDEHRTSNICILKHLEDFQVEIKMLQEAEIVELRLKFFSASIFCFASWTTLIHRRLDSETALKKRPRFASFKTTEVMTSFFPISFFLTSGAVARQS